MHLRAVFLIDNYSSVSCLCTPVMWSASYFTACYIGKKLSRFELEKTTWLTEVDNAEIETKAAIENKLQLVNSLHLRLTISTFVAFGHESYITDRLQNVKFENAVTAPYN